MTPAPALAAGTIAALLLFAACGREEPAEPGPADAPPAAAEAAPSAALPPTAQRPILDELRADLAAVRHAADGGGRGFVEAPPTLVAGGRARLTLVYEVGPRGIAPGGSLRLHTPLWWHWSVPQVADRERAGFVEATTDAAGVTLRLRDVPRTGVLVHTGGVDALVEGRALAAGEQIRLVYGAGPAQAEVDAFAERDERLWLAVDGDGDGVHGLVADSPRVDVAAGPPARLVALLPTTARVGDEVRLTVAALDANANLATSASGEVALDARDAPGLPVPPRAALREGRAELRVRVASPGVHRLRASGPGGLADETNPLVVLPDLPRVLWGDVHGHTQLADGTGTPADYFRYARDVANLDVAAITEHDHIGRRFLDATPEHWEALRRATRDHHVPGRFVTLLGLEWTSWIHGHRHVLWFGDDGEVLSSADPALATPGQLWAALRGQPALTFAHHSGGGPIATDWSIPPDPELEPVTEIVSVHGSSESIDTPHLVHRPVRGNFVRHALARGYRLGFVGSGDSHDGHPGLVQLRAGASGGLAAILAEERSREAVRDALRARRVYATNGPRILLHATLDGAPMGSTRPAAAGGTPSLAVLAVADGVLDRVEVIRGGELVHVVPGEGRARVAFTHALDPLRPGEWLYVRVLQTDRGAAWSSPFFAE